MNEASLTIPEYLFIDGIENSVNILNGHLVNTLFFIARELLMEML